MSSTTTQSKTYTVADVRKVVENFAADFSMIAQATGLRSRESVAETVFDLRVLAENSYLIAANLILKDKVGKQIRAAVYHVSEFAVGWTSGRPGNNLWPRTPDGSLRVIATLTNDWWAMGDATRTMFISNNHMHFSWALTTEDTSFSGLNASSGQRYASNGYGWERKNYG